MNIKIRGWNKKVKRMFYFDELWICSEYDSLAFAYNEGQNEYELHAGHSGLPSNDLSTWEFMLYVNKKGKHEREIYDGDIIKAEWGYGHPQVTVVFEEFIYWNEECCVDDDVEVIGNIWENPELI